MGTGGVRWIWENSRASNGSLIVLLAITDECGKEKTAEMTTAELARKARLSERAVQNAVSDLTALGELSFTPAPGRGKRNRYSPCLGNPADSSVNPAESAPFTETPQNLHPAESAVFNGHHPRSEPSTADSAGFGIPDALNGSVVSGRSSKPSMSGTPPRPDVERLCVHLADRIEANGSKRPNIGKRWKDDARLMLDKDGLSEEQVHQAIDYCQQHHFWHRNILSMEKLRKHYERLRLDWKAEREKKPAPASRQQETDDLFARAMERARAREEAENAAH